MKTKLSMTYETHASLSPIDMAKEFKRKNLRMVKSKEVADITDSVWTDRDSANFKPEQIVVENQQLFGSHKTNSALVDWASWLPFAAKQYNISPDVKDYVVVPIPTIITDLPNRNGVGFPLKELITFRPNLGMQSYKTWKGKPTFQEHCNEDHTQAKGVILDTHLRVMDGLGTWRLLKLLAFDRTRDANLVKNIMDKTYNSYSMGAYVDGYTCSICHKPFGTCSHIPTGLKTGDVIFLSQGIDKLLFKNVVAPEGFETSSVKTPAFISAVNDNVMDMSQILNNNIGRDVEESTIIQLANLDSIHKFSKKDLKVANLNFGEGRNDF